MNDRSSEWFEHSGVLFYMGLYIPFPVIVGFSDNKFLDDDTKLLFFLWLFGSEREEMIVSSKG